MPHRLHSPPNDPAAALAWLDELRSRPRPTTPSTAKAEKTTPEILARLDQLAVPRIKVEESLDQMERAGVQVTLLGPESYVVRGPRAAIAFEGVQISDEVFCNDPLGALNVSKMWRMLRTARPPEVHRMPIDEGLLHQLTGADIEAQTLETVTTERRDLPVLFVFERRGAFLIDGAHRVLARAMQRLSWVHAFIITERALPFIRVRAWRLANDGSRSEVDTTKGYPALFGYPDEL